MIKRAAGVLGAVAILGALIAYSQLRPVARRVSGTIEAYEIRVGSRVGGRVKVVFVEEGQQVSRNEVLLELEPFDLLERENEARETLAARDAEYRRLAAGLRPELIAQAKARYDQLLARRDLLESGPRPQELDAARSRLKVAEAERKFANQALQRQLELSQNNATSQQELDRTKEAVDAAAAMEIVRAKELELLVEGTRQEELREIAAKVEEAKQAWLLASKGYQQEEIEQAKAARDAAQAALDAIGQQRQELSIRSPIDGVIEALELQRGDLVAPGAPVLSLLDHTHLWVRAYVPENQIGLQVQQQLNISVDSFPGEEFRGEVTFISRQAEFTPSNVQTLEERSKQVFRIKVTLQDGIEKLRPGMTADVWLDADVSP